MQVRTFATIPSYLLDVGSTKDAAASPAAAPLDKADDKNAKAASALNQLKQSANSDKEAAADAAKKKLEALRQRLKTLMMMGGDPKAVAKEAAQIAKEIGAAAKAYAKASGGAAAGGAGAGALTADPAGQTAGATQGGDVEGAADGQAPGPTADQAGGDATEGADPATQPSVSGLATETSAAGGSTEDPIVKDARKLAASAKELFKAAALQAQRQHKKGGLDEESKVIQDADQDLDDAGRAMGGGGDVGGYLRGGVAAPEASEPTVSFSA